MLLHSTSACSMSLCWLHGVQGWLQRCHLMAQTSASLSKLVVSSRHRRHREQAEEGTVSQYR